MLKTCSEEAASVRVILEYCRSESQLMHQLGRRVVQADVVLVCHSQANGRGHASQTVARSGLASAIFRVSCTTLKTSAEEDESIGVIMEYYRFESQLIHQL